MLQVCVLLLYTPVQQKRREACSTGAVLDSIPSPTLGGLRAPGLTTDPLHDFTNMRELL